MTLTQKMALAPFSVLVWVLSFAFMAVIFLITAIILPFASYKKSHDWVTAPGFALIARFVTLGQLRITYDPRFDRNRRSMFCMNHTNVFDGHVAAAAIPHVFCGLMDAWQVNIPFYGWLMLLSHGITVHRNKPRGLMKEMIEGAKSRFSDGFSLLVFPEGHRTRDGKLREFKRGVFLMAREAGYPVVPLAVRGMYRVNQRGSFFFRPGPVDVYVGPQMETKGLNDAEIETLMEKTRSLIFEFLECSEFAMKREVVAA